ncbi:MAG: glycosyltransferase family 39 protein, partial [Dehalococcoidia bacterium]|nr:glycosyltransferase family 39 protein [Dehalococcoidia bacterium]
MGYPVTTTSVAAAGSTFGTATTTLSAVIARWRWLLPVGLFAAAFCLYIPSFDAPFIILDYNHLDAIRSTDTGTFFSRIFDPSNGGRDIIGTGDLYRPIYYSTFWLEYQLFGLEPLPYYVFTALLHGTNAVLVWLLARRLTGSHIASVSAGLIWAFHPEYADAVAWVSSITDQLLVLFALTSVLLYAAALDAKGAARWLACGASFAAALLALGAKEPGLAVVPIVVAYHVLLGEPDLVRERRIPWMLLPFLLIPVVYLPLRAILVGNLAMQEDSTQLGLDVFRNIHALSGIAASPFVATEGRVPLITPVAWAGYGLIAALLLVAVLGARRERFLVWWYFVALGPFLTIIPSFIIGRYLYLPFVALAILGGIGIARVTEALRREAVPPYAFALPTAALAGLIVWFGVSNADFQSELNARGEKTEAFIARVKEAYPSPPEGTRLIVAAFPPELSLVDDDGLML